jgi:hypothetical protein
MNMNIITTNNETINTDTQRLIYHQDGSLTIDWRGQSVRLAHADRNYDRIPTDLDPYVYCALDVMFTYDDELFSDCHKDAYGIRPRAGHMYYDGSPAVKQEIWDNLMDAVKDSIDAETERETQAEIEFESLIQTNLKIGAPDRATAIRWIVDALDVVDNNQGADYICYLLGIQYGNKEIANAI